MPTYDRVTVSTVSLQVGFGIVSVKDVRSGTLPLFWSEEAEAYGVFGPNVGPLYVHDVPAKVQYWTNKLIKFLPQQGDLDSTANYDVHAYLPITSPPNQYIFDFTTELTEPWTFSRASEATSVAADGTVEHYLATEPAWHGNHGLQLEPSRTNHFRYSTDFRLDTAKGTDTTLTLYPSIPAPDGSATAYRAAGPNHIWQAATCPNVGQDMCSMWARTISGTGVVGMVNGKFDTVKFMPTLTTEWQRFSRYSGQNTSFYLCDFRDAGVTLSEFLLWGPQCERLAPYPSSFIHNDTGETATTRSETQCSATFAELGSPLPASGFSNGFCGQLVLKLLHPTDDLNSKKYLELSNAARTSLLSLMQIGTSIRLGTYTTSTDWRQLNRGMDSLLEGDMLDIRFKVSPSEGQSIWVNGLKSVNPAYIEGFDELMDIVAVGSQGNFTAHSSMAGTKIRLLPTALSDNAIEGWV